MIVIPIASGLIGVGQTYLNNVIGQRVMQDLRNALYTHLQRMPLRFFTETRTGEIQSRLANDVGGVQNVVTDTASSVFSNFVIVITTLVAMLLLDWRLTALSVAVTPFFLYLTYRVGKIRRSISTETQEVLADVSAITEETLSVSGILLSKTFGQQQAAIERYRIANKRLAALQIRQSMVGRWFFMIVGTIFSITPAFVYYLAGVLLVAGDTTAPTVGDIVAFTTLQSRLFFPLGQLLNVQVEVQGALALFDRIFEYLEMKPGIEDAPDAVALDARTVRGRIRYRNVSFRYPESVVSHSSAGVTGAVEGAPAEVLPVDATAAGDASVATGMGHNAPDPNDPAVAAAVGDADGCAGCRRGRRTPPAVRARGGRLRGAARAARRARRAVRVGEDDDHVPAAAACTTWTKVAWRWTASTSGRSRWRASAT
jgi:ATP-binding cassette subfamily B protein